MREGGVYIVVRELHLGWEDEGVRGACERLVEVLMGDEEGERVGGGNEIKNKEGRDAGGVGEGGKMVTQADVVVEEDEDEDDEIVPIF
jgi:hypothetical protein